MTINYTNTIPEIKRAYALFRRKYAVPRMLLMTLLFGAAFIFGVDFIIKNPTGYTGYLLCGVSLAMSASLWSRPYLAQKRLVRTIETMGDERYTARFFGDRIEIDTEIVTGGEETEVVAITQHGVQTVENPEVLEEAEAQIAATKPETSVIGLTTEELYSAEDEEIFCLFVNKALIYIFPKRCMTEEQVVQLKKYFTEKAI
ncbi:MAG: YcxB family protein [Oscillospiraceae bacterium]|nr:YcxB family protein [Oscillospiraceae bacterium]